MQMKISEIKINPGRRDTQQRNVEEHGPEYRRRWA